MTQEFDDRRQPRKLGLADVSHAHRAAHDDKHIFFSKVLRQGGATKRLDDLHVIARLTKQLI